MMDRKGVSTVVGYVLIIALSTILLTGITLALSGFVEDRKQSSTNSQLGYLNESFNSAVLDIDRTVNRNSGDISQFEQSFSAPDSVNGEQYVIEITEGNKSDYSIVFRTLEGNIREASPINTDIDIQVGTYIGGDVLLVYDSNNNELVIQNDQ